MVIIHGAQWKIFASLQQVMADLAHAVATLRAMPVVPGHPMPANDSDEPVAPLVAARIRAARRRAVRHKNPLRNLRWARAA